MNMEKLNSYIEKCFVDAFKSEKREYDKKSHSFEYIIIYDSRNIGHFYPIFTCKYDRVLRRVYFRLKNNIAKYFDIVYGDTEDFGVSIDSYETYIDINFTRAMIARENDINKRFEISIHDKLDSIPVAGGDYIPAYRYERLIRKYYNINSEDYHKIGGGQYNGLPIRIMTDWKEFKKLWKYTFNQDICPYKIVLSDGLVRL